MHLTRLYFRAIQQQLKTSLVQNRQLFLFLLLMGPAAVVFPLAALSVIFSDQYHPGLRLSCFSLLLFTLYALFQKLDSIAHSGVDAAYLDYLASGARKFSLLLLLWSACLVVIQVSSISWIMAKAESPMMLLLLCGYLLVLSTSIIYYPALCIYVNILAVLAYYIKLNTYDLWLFGWMCLLVALLFLPISKGIFGAWRFLIPKVYVQSVRGVLVGSVFLLALYVLVTQVYGYHTRKIPLVMIVSLLLMNLHLIASRRFVADHKTFGYFVDYIALRKGFLIRQGFSVFTGLFALALATLIWIQQWSLLGSLLFFIFYVLLFGIGLLLLRFEKRDAMLVCNLPGIAGLIWQALI